MEISQAKKKDSLSTLFSKLDTALQEQAAVKEEPLPPATEEPRKKKDPFASIFKQLDAAMPSPSSQGKPISPEPFTLSLKKREPEPQENSGEAKQIQEANEDFLAGFRKFKK